MSLNVSKSVKEFQSPTETDNKVTYLSENGVVKLCMNAIVAGCKTKKNIVRAIMYTNIYMITPLSKFDLGMRVLCNMLLSL